MYKVYVLTHTCTKASLPFTPYVCLRPIATMVTLWPYLFAATPFMNIEYEIY